MRVGSLASFVSSMFGTPERATPVTVDERIDTARALFSAGRDSCDIAFAMGLREAEAMALLNVGRERARVPA